MQELLGVAAPLSGLRARVLSRLRAAAIAQWPIGTLDNHAPPELLFDVVTEFMIEINERFGSHVHILDWALHLDESTPHIHERHGFDCENKYGEIAPQQEKALEALGFELPDPEKPP